ncbi:MAG: type II toxin-antitoxin system VapC family toxin [Planctomycetes bacterium]|nr:type II toxin-antitoxin system VapC family toxin [Planctomycetota bacterium]
MANSTLVDTDILMDAGRGIADAIACLQNAQSASSLATSIVSEMELIVGCRDKAELRTVGTFLQQFHVVKINETISDKAVELLTTHRLSHGLLIADSIIAATALVLEWDLITKNQRDYRFIAGLTLLAYP